MALIRRHHSTFLLAFILIAFFGMVVSPSTSAQAHANLLRSEPESGATLDRAPVKVTLEFSEPLDPDLSKARLADANLVTLAEGPGSIDTKDNRILTLDLPAIPDGAYNVIWQARSATDGHLTSGIVSFAVGGSAASFSLLPKPGASNPTNAVPAPVDTLLRWTGYLAAALAAGSLLFAVLVWRPAYHAWDQPEPSSDLIAGRRLRAISLLGCAGMLAISLALVLFQAWQVSRSVYQVSYSQAIQSLLGLPGGWVFWLRVALLSVLIYRSTPLSRPGEGTATQWWLAITLGLSILLTISLQSHAAALGNPAAVFSDWVHLTAMAAWLGGLLPLFLLLRQTELPAHLLVPKFSRLALVSVAALAISGLYNASIHVRTLQALLSTVYGEALAGKTLLFAILFSIGAVNLLVLSPRLSRAGRDPARRLRNNVRIELALGLMILALVALMTGVSPAFEALQARQRLGYIGEYKHNGVKLDLWIAPARVGENEVAVDVSGLPEASTEQNPQIILRVQPTAVKLGVTQVETARTSPSRFTARGSYLNIAGDWQVEVILRRPGVNDVRHTFQVPVQSNPYLTDIVNPIPSTETSVGAGKVLYESNCLACHGAQGKGDGPAGLALRPPPADLTIHTAPGVHPDGQLFEWITNGYPGSAMPAFTKFLSDEQRWNLVNYIRTLSRK